MKIQAIQNYQYNNFKFTGATVPHYQINRSQNNNDNNNNKGQIPEWARKGVLAVLVFFAFKNDPAVQNLMKSADTEREEKTRTEFFEDVSKLSEKENLAPATYHLNRFADVDNIGIKSKGRENYNLEINLDSIKTNTFLTILPIDNNSISGSFRNNGEHIRYRAIFSKDNPDEFTVILRNKNNDKYTFGRTPRGEFYRLDGKKKVILNKKNVEKYQKSIENIPNFEDMQDIKFFTNENDMWRKLNIILLVFLLFAEMSHDNARRKQNKKD